MQQQAFRCDRRIAPPAESALNGLFAGADLIDAYAISLPPEATRDINRLARAVLGAPPLWFRALLAIRDGVMARFGVKSSRRVRDGAVHNNNQTIDFFPILGSFERELVVGEDDNHLDFRASILLRRSQSGACDDVVATTVVRCHNPLGRVYIAVIAPFHRLIVSSNLRRAARRGWPRQ